MSVCWPHFSTPHLELFPHELCIYLHECRCSKIMHEILNNIIWNISSSESVIATSFLPCVWTLIHAFHQIQVFYTSQLDKAIVCDDREADKDVL